MDLIQGRVLQLNIGALKAAFAFFQRESACINISLQHK